MRNDEHAGDGNKNEQKQFVYHVDNKKYETDKSSITGAQIKAAIPNYNPAFQLFLEGHGNDPDRVVADSELVTLDHGSKHFYTAPPATFGCARWPD